MRHVRTTTGPIATRPFYSTTDIEHICTDALQSTELLPRQPEPVRIERFIERHFRLRPTYDDLPTGLLGFTEFGPTGVHAIHVARSLSENGDTADRVLSSTLAHEAGHGLLQAHLFVLDEAPHLFDQDPDVTTTRILCRQPGHTGGYDGRWWEVQANMTIGALLIPRTLLDQSLQPHLRTTPGLGIRVLFDDQRRDAIHDLAETFHVTEAVATIRLDSTHPPTHGQRTF